MLGGLGPCGRPICCGTFLGDFQPVSIKMAKEQNLSLNPTKISGVCGRLMCCLKYEQENYEQIRKQMPKVGKEVITPEGTGVVWELNVIKETVRVRLQKGDSSELKDFPMTDVQRVNLPQNVRAPKAEETPAAEAQESAEGQETTREETAENRRAQKRPPRGNREERAPRKDERTAEESKENRVPGLGKPVMRENPKRRKEAAEKAAVAEKEKPAVQPRKEPPKPKETAREGKPAISPWQQAVAQALRAAQEDERVEEKPILAEDHEDTFLFTEEESEDDTI